MVLHSSHVPQATPNPEGLLIRDSWGGLSREGLVWTEKASLRRQLSQDMNEGISPVDIRAGAGWAGGGSCAKALKQNVPGVARLWGPPSESRGQR